jgi:hypothetical protein
VLGEVVGGGERGVDRRAADREQDPDQREDEAELRVRLLGDQRDAADAGRRDSRRLEDLGGGDQDPDAD